uniref:G_PROTEIN_RECEP_F2_4 domain-containing protein n=1 Tax=Macrostomum lignano TaxID=282301 RepID=A0A1I8HI53_9PLAT
SQFALVHPTGLPVVPTIVWSGVVLWHNEHNPNKCWKESFFSNFYWILSACRIFTFAINIGFLLNVLRVLVMRLREIRSNETQQMRKALRAAFLLLPLLGITNVICTVPDPVKTVNFIVVTTLKSCLLSFQGLFLALMYCFLDKEVQATLSRLLARHRLRRSRTPGSACSAGGVVGGGIGSAGGSTSRRGNGKETIADEAGLQLTATAAICHTAGGRHLGQFQRLGRVAVAGVQPANLHQQQQRLLAGVPGHLAVQFAAASRNIVQVVQVVPLHLAQAGLLGIREGQRNILLKQVQGHEHHGCQVAALAKQALHLSIEADQCVVHYAPRLLGCTAPGRPSDSAWYKIFISSAPADFLSCGSRYSRTQLDSTLNFGLASSCLLSGLSSGSLGDSSSSSTSSSSSASAKSAASSFTRSWCGGEGCDWDLPEPDGASSLMLLRLPLTLARGSAASSWSAGPGYEASRRLHGGGIPAGRAGAAVLAQHVAVVVVQAADLRRLRDGGQWVLLAGERRLLEQQLESVLGPLVIGAAHLGVPAGGQQALRVERMPADVADWRVAVGARQTAQQAAAQAVPDQHVARWPVVAWGEKRALSRVRDTTWPTTPHWCPLNMAAGGAVDADRRQRRSHNLMMPSSPELSSRFEPRPPSAQQTVLTSLSPQEDQRWQNMPLLGPGKSSISSPKFQLTDLSGRKFPSRVSNSRIGELVPCAAHMNTSPGSENRPQKKKLRPFSTTRVLLGRCWCASATFATETREAPPPRAAASLAELDSAGPAAEVQELKGKQKDMPPAFCPAACEWLQLSAAPPLESSSSRSAEQVANTGQGRQAAGHSGQGGQVRQVGQVGAQLLLQAAQLPQSAPLVLKPALTGGQGGTLLAAVGAQAEQTSSACVTSRSSRWQSRRFLQASTEASSTMCFGKRDIRRRISALPLGAAARNCSSARICSESGCSSAASASAAAAAASRASARPARSADADAATPAPPPAGLTGPSCPLSSLSPSSSFGRSSSSSCPTATPTATVAGAAADAALSVPVDADAVLPSLCRPALRGANLSRIWRQHCSWSGSNTCRSCQMRTSRSRLAITLASAALAQSFMAWDSTALNTRRNSGPCLRLFCTTSFIR